MDKKKEIKKVLQMMQDKEVTLDDVIAYCSAKEEPQFDLLCEVNGTLRRLPFIKGKALNPIGIFPLRENIYLELDEKPLGSRPACLDKILPPLEFWEKVFKIRKQVNACLAKLHAPLLEGVYFGEDTTAKAEDDILNWVAKMVDCPETITTYCSWSTHAKTRYCGYFKE